MTGKGPNVTVILFTFTALVLQDYKRDTFYVYSDFALCVLAKEKGSFCTHVLKLAN